MGAGVKKYFLQSLAVSIGAICYFSVVYASTTQSFQYDANGNLIQGEGKYYEYNDANQLVKVRHKDQNGPVIAEYVYDYTGQRIKKIENGTATYYIGKHFEHQIAGSAQTNISYYFANKERVAKKDPSGDLSYYHADHLGGTNIITDVNGNLVEQIKYYPFGGIREGGAEKYAFTGKEKDKLTDWYYYEARYYNPDFLHFTQADTIVPEPYDPQSLNRYAYVINNPIKFIDPDGHEKVYVINKSTGAANAGHEAIIVEKDEKYHYFSKGPDKGLVSSTKITKKSYKKNNIENIVSRINEDFGESYDGIYEINTSKFRSDKMYKYSNSFWRSIQPYILLGFDSNCKDFVRDVLKQGGIETSNSTYPNNFYANLVENGHRETPLNNDEPSVYNNQNDAAQTYTAFEGYLQAVEELNQK